MSVTITSGPLCYGEKKICLNCKNLGSIVVDENVCLNCYKPTYIRVYCVCGNTIGFIDKKKSWKLDDGDMSCKSCRYQL